MEKDDDLELIERVKSGRKEDFAVLVRRYEARLRGMCTNMLFDYHAAEDAVQETFLRAYRSIATFRADCPFVAWLYRIAANVCRDQLRQRSKRDMPSWDELRESQGDRIEAMRSMPAEQGFSVEHRQTLHLVLKALTPEQREILLLREAEGFSYQEIASIMGVSVDSVKAKLRRTREKIDAELRHFFEGPAVENMGGKRR